MVAFGRLGRYFGRRFIGAVMLVFINCALLRLPAYSEQMFPFAVLLGAMASFLTLSRRLELVIARTVGASVWQFTLSTLVLAVLLGTFLTTVYNPISAALKERANKIE